MTLKRLLAAWKTEKSNELRAAILSAQNDTASFEGTTAQWLKRASTDDDLERAALIATLKGPTVSETVDRLKRARTFPPDPRVTAALEAFIRAVPYSADSSKPAWTAAFALVAESKDPFFATFDPQWKVRDLMKKWLTSAWARAIEELPREVPAVSAKVRELIAAQPAPKKKEKPATGEVSEEAMLAAVYAHPFDDAPRLAYADFLMQRGDERGEFIALQCAGKDEARQEALLKKHAKKWLAPLAPVLGKLQLFRRGFLAEATVKFRHQADAEKFGPLPEWGTVERLTWQHQNTISRGQEPWCLYAGPNMRALKYASGAWVPHLLAAKEPWAIEELHLHAATPAHLKDAVASPLLPKLARIELDYSTAGWLSKLEWPERITSLRVPRYTSAREVLKPASALRLQRFELGEQRTFSRGSDGTLSHLHIEPHGVTDAMLREMAEQLPDDALEAVTFGEEVDPDVKAAYRKKVRAAGKASPLPKAGTVKQGPEPLPPLEGVVSLDTLEDGTVMVFEGYRLRWVDVTGKLQLREEPFAGGHGGFVTPRGELLVIGNKKLERCDVADGRPLKSVNIGLVHTLSVSISADGKTASLGPRAIDLASLEELKAPRGAGLFLHMAPDQSCWVRYAQPACTLHRPGSREALPLEHGDALHRPFFSGGVLYARTPLRLCAWSCADASLLRTVETGQGALVLGRSRDGKLLAVHTAAGTVDVLEAATFERVASVPCQRPLALAFTRDAKTLLVAEPKKLSLFEIGTRSR